MPKLQKKTHNITSKMRNNASFPVVRARGRQDGKLEHASEASGQLRGLGQPVRAHGLDQRDKNAFPLCCLSGFLTPVTGKFCVKLLALEDMRCLGLESISGLGSFLEALVTVDRIACVAVRTSGQSLFVPYGFLPVVNSLQSKENVDKGAFLHRVQNSDANHHMFHKFNKQAISEYFVSAFAQLELGKTWLENKTGMEDCPVGRDGLHYTLKVIERERRTCLWTSAPCTLHPFQLRYDVQHEVDGGSTVFASRHAALCFQELGGSLCFCLQLLKMRF